MGKQKTAEEQAVVAEIRPTQQPISPFTPSQEQKGDMRALQGATENRGISPLINQSEKVDAALKSADPATHKLAQDAQNILEWTNKFASIQVAGHDFTSQTNMVVGMTKDAFERGDSALMKKAQDTAISLNFIAAANYYSAASGSPDAKELGRFSDSAITLFNSGEALRALNAALGVLEIEKHPSAMNDRANQENRGKAFAALERISDPKIPLGNNELNMLASNVFGNVSAAVVRTEGSASLANLSMMQLHALMASEAVQEKFKSQLDSLHKDIEKLVECISDKKRSKEENDKEKAEVDEKTQKFIAEAIAVALVEKGAPEALVAAVKNAQSFLKKPELRERGERLLALGASFLQNHDALKLKENSKLLKEFTAAAEKLSLGKEKLTAGFRSGLSELEGKAIAATAAYSRSLPGMVKEFEGAVKELRAGAAMLGDKYFKRAVDEIQERLKNIKAPEQLRDIANAVRYLQNSIRSLLRMPQRDDNEKKTKGEAAALAANAALVSLKGSMSEEAKVARFASMDFLRTADNEYKAALKQISEGLKQGTMKVGDAKAMIVSHLQRQADVLLKKIRGANPKIADGISLIFQSLKKEPKKASLDMLKAAVSALNFGLFTKDKVLPCKNETVKKEALGLVGKALGALHMGETKEANSMFRSAFELLRMPERKAAARLDERDKGAEERRVDARSMLMKGRRELLGSMSKAPKAIQERLGNLAKDLKSAIGLLGKQETAVKVTDEELGILDLRLRMAQKISNELEKTEQPGVLRDLASIYSSALDALAKKSEGPFKTFMLAAEELKQGSGLTGIKFRNGLMACLDRLAKDPSTKNMEDAERTAVKALGESLSSRLDRVVKDLPQEVRKGFEGIKAGLEGGKGLSAMETAARAIELAKRGRGIFSNAFLSNKKASEPERKDSVAIFKLALDALCAGAEPGIVSMLGFLAERCIGADETQRSEIFSLSRRLGKDPDVRQAVRDVDTYGKINDQAAMLRKGMGTLPKTHPSRASLGKILTELDKAKSRLALGEGLADEPRVKMYQEQMAGLAEKNENARNEIEGRAGEIAAKRGTEAGETGAPEIIDADRRAAILEAAKGAATSEGLQRILGLTELGTMILSGGARIDKGLEGIHTRAAGEYEADHPEKAMVLSLAAKIYAETKGTRDKAEITKIAEACASGQITLAQAQFMLSTYGPDRTEYGKKVNDPALIRNAEAYFDLAARSAWKNDMADAEAISRLARNYLGLAALPLVQLNPESRKSREAMMARIEGELGDYRKQPEILKGKRLLDAGAEGKDGWLLKEGSIASPLALAALSGKNIQEALGSERTASLKPLSTELTDGMVGLWKLVDFDSIIGAGETKEKTIDAAWDADRKRLTGLAETNRKGKQDELAELFDSEAAMVDRGFVKDAVAKAKGMLASAHDENVSADGFMAEAERAQASAQAAEAEGRTGGLDELKQKAEGLADEADTHRKKAETLSGMATSICENLLAMDRSVRKTNTKSRESGRLNLMISVKTSLAIGSGQDADVMGEAILPEEEAAGLSPIRAGALIQQAEAAGEAGRKEVQEQQDIMRTRDSGIAGDKVALHDESIRKMGGILYQALAQKGWDEAEKEKYSGLIAESLKSGNITQLQQLYTNLVGGRFTDVDGKSKNDFDVEENERKYQTAVGLWWGERFGSARAFSKSAKSDINEREYLATLGLDAQRVKEQHFAALGPDPAGFLQGHDNYFLLKQLISHLPPMERMEYRDKLKVIGRGDEGHQKRGELYESLKADKRFLTDKTVDKIEDRVESQQPSHFNAEDLHDRAMALRRLRLGGNASAAESGFMSLREDTALAMDVQELDDKRVMFDRKEYDYYSDSKKLRADILPSLPIVPTDQGDGTKILAEREKRKTEDERAELEPGVSALEASMLARADENSDASDRYARAREGTESNGGRIAVDESNIQFIIDDLPQKTKEAIQPSLDAALGIGDERKRRAKVQEIWNGLVREHPVELRQGVTKAYRRGEESAFNEGELAQLDALALGALVAKRNMQMDHSEKPLILRRIDNARGMLERGMFQARDEKEKEVALRIARNSIRDAVEIAEDFKDPELKDWREDPARAKKIREEDLNANKDAFRLMFSAVSLADDVKGEAIEEYAKMKTDLQLMLMGVKVDAQGNVEKVELSPEEYKRVALAYSQFNGLEGDMNAILGKGVEGSFSADAGRALEGAYKAVMGGEESESEYLGKNRFRARQFFLSAQRATRGGTDEERKLALAAADSAYEAGEPAREKLGRRFDPDEEMKGYARTMSDWEMGVDIGVKGGKTFAYGAAYASGGPATWVAGGVQAIEGVMGLMDYYESAGGDWNMMTTGEQVNLGFQGLTVVLGAASIGLGELTQWQQAAKLAEAGGEIAVGGGVAMAPTMLSRFTGGVGKTLLWTGVYQTGNSLIDYGMSAADDRMPLGFALANMGVDFLTGIAQPAFHAINAAKMQMTGLPIQRSRLRQLVELGFLGTSLDNSHQFRVQYEEAVARKGINDKFETLLPSEQQAFHSYINERQIAAPEAQSEILDRYLEVRKAGKVTFPELEARTIGFTQARMRQPGLRFEDYFSQQREELAKQMADHEDFLKGLPAQAEAPGGIVAKFYEERRGREEVTAPERLVTPQERKPAPAARGKTSERLDGLALAAANEEGKRGNAGRTLRQELADFARKVALGDNEAAAELATMEAGDPIRLAVEGIKTRLVESGAYKSEEKFGKFVNVYGALYLRRAVETIKDVAAAKTERIILAPTGTDNIAVEVPAQIAHVTRVKEAESPAAKKEEGRFAEQNAKFRQRGYSEERMEDGIFDWFDRSRTQGTEPPTPFLEIAWLRTQAPAVREEIAGRISKRVKERLGEKWGKSAEQMMGIFLSKDIYDYKPFVEIDPAFTTDRHSLGGAPEEVTLWPDVLKKGAKEQIRVHGIQRSKWANALGYLINISLEGTIRAGQVDQLIGGDASSMANMFGPFFVIVPPGTRDVTGVAGTGKPITEESHVAYLVPNERYRKQMAGAFSEGIEKGLISAEKAAAALAKVVTYNEFIAAPEGSFSQPGNDFISSRLKAGKEMLQDATVARRLAKEYDSMKAPFSKDSLWIMRIESEPASKGMDSFENAFEYASRMREIGKPLSLEAEPRVKLTVVTGGKATRQPRANARHEEPIEVRYRIDDKEKIFRAGKTAPPTIPIKELDKKDVQGKPKLPSSPKQRSVEQIEEMGRIIKRVYPAFDESTAMALARNLDDMGQVSEFFLSRVGEVFDRKIIEGALRKEEPGSFSFDDAKKIAEKGVGAWVKLAEEANALTALTPAGLSAKIEGIMQRMKKGDRSATEEFHDLIRAIKVSMRAESTGENILIPASDAFIHEGEGAAISSSTPEGVMDRIKEEELGKISSTTERGWKRMRVWFAGFLNKANPLNIRKRREERRGLSTLFEEVSSHLTPEFIVRPEALAKQYDPELVPAFAPFSKAFRKVLEFVGKDRANGLYYPKHNVILINNDDIRLFAAGKKIRGREGHNRHDVKAMALHESIHDIIKKNTDENVTFIGKDGETRKGALPNHWNEGFAECLSMLDVVMQGGEPAGIGHAYPRETLVASYMMELVVGSLAQSGLGKGAGRDTAKRLGRAVFREGVFSGDHTTISSSIDGLLGPGAYEDLRLISMWADIRDDQRKGILEFLKLGKQTKERISKANSPMELAPGPERDILAAIWDIKAYASLFELGYPRVGEHLRINEPSANEAPVAFIEERMNASRKAAIDELSGLRAGGKEDEQTLQRIAALERKVATIEGIFGKMLYGEEEARAPASIDKKLAERKVLRQAVDVDEHQARMKDDDPWFIGLDLLNQDRIKQVKNHMGGHKSEMAGKLPETKAVPVAPSTTRAKKKTGKGAPIESRARESALESTPDLGGMMKELGISDQEEAFKRIAKEAGMSAHGKAVLQILEGQHELGIRTATNGEEQAQRKLNENGVRSENILHLLEDGGDFQRRFKLATPEERAIIAEAISKGASPGYAFQKVAIETLPKKSAQQGPIADETEFGSGLVRFAENLAKINDENEIHDRLNDIAATNPIIAGAIEQILDPETRAWFANKLPEAKHQAALKKAELDAIPKTPEGRAILDYYALGHDPQKGPINEPEWLRDTASRRGLAQGHLAKEYRKGLDTGGIDGAQRHVLKALGIKVPDAGSLKPEFDLVVRGDLEGRIRELKGFESATIKEIAFLGGGTGGYKVSIELQTPEGMKETFMIVKRVDGRADEFGRRIAKALGYPSSKIHATDSKGNVLSYETGVEFMDPANPDRMERGRQEFVIIESITDLRGERLMVHGPQGDRETNFSHVMLFDQIMHKLDQNAPEWKAGIVPAFYRMMATEGGRAAVFKAWLEYHERCRQGLFGDRNTRNTAIGFETQETVEDGKPVMKITGVNFLPIDMDAIGFAISPGLGGKPDLNRFNQDFATATRSMLGHLAFGAEVAANNGVIGSQLDMRMMVAEMNQIVGEQKALDPPDGYYDASERVLGVINDERNAGVPFGFAPGKEGPIPIGKVSSSNAGLMDVSTNRYMRPELDRHVGEHIGRVVKFVAEPQARGVWLDTQQQSLGSMESVIAAVERGGRAGKNEVVLKAYYDADKKVVAFTNENEPPPREVDASKIIRIVIDNRSGFVKRIEAPQELLAKLAGLNLVEKSKVLSAYPPYGTAAPQTKARQGVKEVEKRPEYTPIPIERQNEEAFKLIGQALAGLGEGKSVGVAVFFNDNYEPVAMRKLGEQAPPGLVKRFTIHVDREGKVVQSSVPGINVGDSIKPKGPAEAGAHGAVAADIAVESTVKAPDEGPAFQPLRTKVEKPGGVAEEATEVTAAPNPPAPKPQIKAKETIVKEPAEGVAVPEGMVKPIDESPQARLPATSIQYGEGLGAIVAGDRVLIFDGGNIIGKHGAGGASAGSKLGAISDNAQLMELLAGHVDLSALGPTITNVPNVPTGQQTGTDAMVTILSVRKGTLEVVPGTPLEQGVEYTARVKTAKVGDIEGVEFEAPMRLEVVRKGKVIPGDPSKNTKDTIIPDIIQPLVFTDRKPVPTDKLNFVILKTDLNNTVDPKTAWMNKGELEKQAGKSLDGVEAFAVLTAFPGEYAPAANPPRNEVFDQIVGMTGIDFWNSHALMRQLPLGEKAPIAGQASKAEGAQMRAPVLKSEEVAPAQKAQEPKIPAPKPTQVELEKTIVMEPAYEFTGGTIAERTPTLKPRQEIAEKTIVIEQEPAGGTEPSIAEKKTEESLPKTTNELLELYESLDRGKKERGETGSGFGSALLGKDPSLIGVLQAMAAHPESREALAEGWEKAMSSKAGAQALDKAKRSTTIEEKAQMDLAAIEGGKATGEEDIIAMRAKAIGKKGDEVEALRHEVIEAYNEAFGKRGSVEDARLAVMGKLRINIKVDPNVVGKEASIEKMFIAVMKGNLETWIIEQPGFEGSVLREIVAMDTGSEAFMATMRREDGQERIAWVKLADGRADVLGGEHFKEMGFITPRVFAADSDGNAHSFKIAYTDKESGTAIDERKELMMTEDVHDMTGRTSTIRLPDGPTCEVLVKGVATMRGEVLNPEYLDKKKTPVTESARMAMKAFYEEAGSEGGRDRIVAAEADYLERSHLAGISDRFSRNTVLVVVERVLGRNPDGSVITDGKPVMTFQPIDLDPLLLYAGVGEDGRPDFTGYNRDFDLARKEFVQTFSFMLDKMQKRGHLAEPLHGASEIDASMFNSLEGRFIAGMDADLVARAKKVEGLIGSDKYMGVPVGMASVGKPTRIGAVSNEMGILGVSARTDRRIDVDARVRKAIQDNLARLHSPEGRKALYRAFLKGALPVLPERE